MKYSFDAYQLYLAATSSICSYVSLPPYPAWSSVTVTVTVVKESSTRSLFSFCYDILDSHLSLLSRIHIHLFFLSRCIVLLTPISLPCFPPPLYLTSFDTPSLHHSYQLSPMFSLLVPHYIGLLSVLLTPLLLPSVLSSRNISGIK